MSLSGNTRPAITTITKEMLLIADNPIIQWCVEELPEAGREGLGGRPVEFSAEGSDAYAEHPGRGCFIPFCLF